MHTLQWIAVEAESQEQAEQSVLSKLEEYGSGGNWFDWYDTDIGGRWSIDSKTTCANNSDEYMKILRRIKKGRYEEIKSLRERMDLEELASAINAYEGEDLNLGDYQMNLWRISKAIDIIGNEWGNSSYYYDTETWSTELSSLKERVTTNPDSQWLVPIDFHF